MLAWSDASDQEQGSTGAVRSLLLASLIALGLALAAVGVIAASNDGAANRGGAFFSARGTAPGAGDERDCPRGERDDDATADQIL